MKSLHRLFILTIFLLIPLFCYGQEKIRIVEKALTSNEPIELVNLKVKDKPFDAENQVLADKDWLNKLNLKLKNTSDKTIVYIRLELEITRLGKMQYPLRLPLEFGQIPSITSSENAKVSGLNISERVTPGKTVKVSLQPKFYDFLLQFMQENEIEDIERVKVFFEFIVFDNGTAWSKGYEMRRNLKNPNQWDVVGDWQKEMSKFQNRFMLNESRILAQANNTKWNKTLSDLSTQPSFFFANCSTTKPFLPVNLDDT